MGQDPLIGRVLHDTHEIVRLMGKRHRLRVAARGHVTVERELVADASRTIRVALKKAGKKLRPRARTRGGRL